MTVYHYGAEVEVVGGHTEEGWALVKHEDKDVQDVNISELKATNITDEVFDKILSLANDNETAIGDDMKNSYVPIGDGQASERIPLDVRMYSETVHIVAEGGHLVDASLWDIQDNAEDDYEAVQKIFRLFHQVSMAYQQPTRLVWKNMDKLVEAEA